MSGDVGSPGRPQHTLTLDPVPDLRRSLALGALGSATAAASRRRDVTPDDLPDLTVRAAGLTADPTRLTDYQHLVGETASDALPAGFVHVLAFPLAMALMARPDFPLPVLGMVHLTNVVTQRRAVRLGEALEVTAYAADLRAHHRGVSVDLVAEVAVGGEPVWRGVSTYLVKGYRLAGASTPERVDRPDRQAPTPTGAWRLPADLGRRYAAVSGDHNPIHTTPLAARALGFPRAIAHGMYTAARALAEVPRDEAFTWTAEFLAPIVLPSTVSVGVREGSGRGQGERRAGGTVDVWGRREHLHVRVDPPA